MVDDVFCIFRVWALDLASGNDESGFEHNSTYALFSVNINLTEEGLQHIDGVIGAVFKYVELLKKHGADARIWREIQTIEDMAFRYVEDSPPVDYVESLSENVHKFPPAECIVGDTLFFDYDPQVRRHFDK